MKTCLGGSLLSFLLANVSHHWGKSNKPSLGLYRYKSIDSRESKQEKPFYSNGRTGHVRKITDSHERGTGQLKSTVKQKSNEVN
jgi:hypothetical protein